ncbi:MAG TPA: ABC transporter permease [Rhodospirillales bacterium]|nr:ABC transporter permease [Rhodospirillales bacterium]
MTASRTLGLIDKAGRWTVSTIEEIGNGGLLMAESLYWIIRGPSLNQPVRPSAIIVQMMEIGIKAVPIIALLGGTIGAMLAIQSIYMLRIFGAESQVTYGVAFSVVREFAPLITGILIAGRSGSALAARLGTMKISQEIDALKVMGINPVRFLAVPALIALVVMVPALTLFNMFVGLFCAGLYIEADLGISLAAYMDQTITILSLDDLLHGVGKSVLFAVLVGVIGVINGASVTGGAEGVGKVTTRAVVQSISAIIVTDMLFAFMATR